MAKRTISNSTHQKLFVLPISSIMLATCVSKAQHKIKIPALQVGRDYKKFHTVNISHALSTTTNDKPLGNRL